MFFICHPKNPFLFPPKKFKRPAKNKNGKFFPEAISRRGVLCRETYSAMGKSRRLVSTTGIVLVDEAEEMFGARRGGGGGSKVKNSKVKKSKADKAAAKAAKKAAKRAQQPLTPRKGSVVFRLRSTSKRKLTSSDKAEGTPSPLKRRRTENDLSGKRSGIRAGTESPAAAAKQFHTMDSPRSAMSPVAKQIETLGRRRKRRTPGLEGILGGERRSSQRDFVFDPENTPTTPSNKKDVSTPRKGSSARRAAFGSDLSANTPPRTPERATPKKLISASARTSTRKRIFNTVAVNSEKAKRTFGLTAGARTPAAPLSLPPIATIGGLSSGTDGASAADPPNPRIFSALVHVVCAESGDLSRQLVTATIAADRHKDSRKVRQQHARTATDAPAALVQLLQRVDSHFGGCLLPTDAVSALAAISSGDQMALRDSIAALPPQRRSVLRLLSSMGNFVADDFLNDVGTDCAAYYVRTVCGLAHREDLAWCFEAMVRDVAESFEAGFAPVFSIDSGSAVVADGPHSPCTAAASAAATRAICYDTFVGQDASPIRTRAMTLGNAGAPHAHGGLRMQVLQNSQPVPSLSLGTFSP
jgi:hypothetical protein